MSDLIVILGYLSALSGLFLLSTLNLTPIKRAFTGILVLLFLLGLGPLTLYQPLLSCPASTVAGTIVTLQSNTEGFIHSTFFPFRFLPVLLKYALYISIFISLLALFMAGLRYIRATNYLIFGVSAIWMFFSVLAFFHILPMHIPNADTLSSFYILPFIPQNVQVMEFKPSCNGQLYISSYFWIYVLTVSIALAILSIKTRSFVIPGWLKKLLLIIGLVILGLIVILSGVLDLKIAVIMGLLGVVSAFFAIKEVDLALVLFSFAMILAGFVR